MLSHFGSEHFCPLSMLRVFGTTMMEEYEYSESQRDQNKQQQHNGERAGGGEGAGAPSDHGDDESPTIPVNPGEREWLYIQKCVRYFGKFNHKINFFSPCL